MKPLNILAGIPGEITQLVVTNSVFSTQVPAYAIRSTDGINKCANTDVIHSKSTFTTHTHVLHESVPELGMQLKTQKYLAFSGSFFAQNLSLVLRHTFHFSVCRSCISCHFFLIRIQERGYTKVMCSQRRKESCLYTSPS